MVKFFAISPFIEYIQFYRTESSVSITSRVAISINWLISELGNILSGKIICIVLPSFSFAKALKTPL